MSSARSSSLSDSLECDFFAVTGTNGKTTTTSLLASMLSESGLSPSWPPATSDCRSSTRCSRLVTMAQSLWRCRAFSSRGIHEFRPRVAGAFERRRGSHRLARQLRQLRRGEGSDRDEPDRRRRLRSQSRRCRGDVDAQGVGARSFPFPKRRCPRTGLDGTTSAFSGATAKVLTADDVPLPGSAGREDVAAAAGAALEYGVDLASVRRAVESFQPLAHRIEVIAEAGGVTYINDSKATNPHATLAATKGLRDVVLIAGGRAKGIDLSVLRGTVPPVVEVIALGEAAGEVESAFDGLVEVTAAGSMDEAVGVARLKGNSWRIRLALSRLCFARHVRELRPAGRGVCSRREKDPDRGSGNRESA